jgi:hypothetical protein
MHFEMLVEDSSGMRLLEILVPQLLGPTGEPHTWRLHPYKGVGRLPKGLKPKSDASKRILLDQLPRLLKGFVQVPGVDKVIVVLDSDEHPCVEFLNELRTLALNCGSADKTLFRLAIEELEAWYFGDPIAVKAAYPRVNAAVFSRYVQDSICGTWEMLADAILPGGSKAIKKNGWTASGQVKHDWAEKIGPRMDLDRNVSPSFRKFRDGLRALANSDL